MLCFLKSYSKSQNRLVSWKLKLAKKPPLQEQMFIVTKNIVAITLELLQ